MDIQCHRLRLTAYPVLGMLDHAGTSTYMPFNSAGGLRSNFVWQDSLTIRVNRTGVWFMLYAAAEEGSSVASHLARARLDWYD